MLMRKRVLAFVLTLLVIVSNFSGVRFVEAKDGNVFASRWIIVKYNLDDNSCRVKYMLDYDRDTGVVNFKGERLPLTWTQSEYLTIPEIEYEVPNAYNWETDDTYGASQDFIHHLEENMFGKAIEGNGEINTEGVDFSLQYKSSDFDKIVNALGIVINGNDAYFRLARWNPDHFDEGPNGSFSNTRWYKRGSSDFQDKLMLYGGKDKSYGRYATASVRFAGHTYVIVDDNYQPSVALIESSDYNNETGGDITVINASEEVKYLNAIYHDWDIRRDIKFKIPFKVDISLGKYFSKIYSDGYKRDNPLFDKNIYLEELKKDSNEVANKLSDEDFYGLVDASLTENTPYKIVDLSCNPEIYHTTYHFKRNFVIFKKDGKLWIKKHNFGHSLKKYGDDSNYPWVNVVINNTNNIDDELELFDINVFGKNIKDNAEQEFGDFLTDGAVALDDLLTTEGGVTFLNAVASFKIGDNYFFDLHTPGKPEVSFFKMNGDLELSGRPMIKGSMSFGENNYSEVIPRYVILTDDFKPDYYLTDTNKYTVDNKFVATSFQDGVTFVAELRSSGPVSGDAKMHRFKISRDTDIKPHLYDYITNGDVVNNKANIEANLENNTEDAGELVVLNTVDVKESSITDDKKSSFVFTVNVLQNGVPVSARYLVNYRIFRADGKFYVSKNLRKLADGEEVPEDSVNTVLPYIGAALEGTVSDLDYEKALFVFDRTLFGMNVPVDESLTKGVDLKDMKFKSYLNYLYTIIGISRTDDEVFYNLTPITGSDKHVIHYPKSDNAFMNKLVLPLNVAGNEYRLNGFDTLQALSESFNKAIVENVNIDTDLRNPDINSGVLKSIKSLYIKSIPENLKVQAYIPPLYDSLGELIYKLPDRVNFYKVDNMYVVFDNDGNAEYIISDGVYKLKANDKISLSGKPSIDVSKDKGFVYFLNTLDNNAELIKRLFDFAARKFKSSLFTKESLVDYMNSMDARKGEMPAEWKDAGYLSKFDLSDYNAGKQFKAIRFNMYDIVRNMPFDSIANYDRTSFYNFANELYVKPKPEDFNVDGYSDGLGGFNDDAIRDFAKGKITYGSYELWQHIGVNGISPTDYDTVLFSNRSQKANRSMGAESHYNVRYDVVSDVHFEDKSDVDTFEKAFLEGRSYFTSKLISKIFANISVTEMKEADYTKLSFFENGNKINILPFAGGVLAHDDQTLNYILEDIIVKNADNDSVKWASDGASFTYEKDGKTYVKGKRKGLQTGSIVYVKSGDFVYGISIIDLPLRYKDYDGKKVPVYDVNNAKFVYKKFPLPEYNYLLDGIDRTNIVSGNDENKVELKKDTVYAMPKKIFYEMYDSSVSEEGGTTKPDNRLKYVDILNYEDINKVDTGSNLLQGGYSIDDSDASSWYYKLPKSEPSVPIPVYPPESDIPVPPPDYLFSVGPLRAVLSIQREPKVIPYPTPNDVKYINVHPIDGNGDDSEISVIDKNFDSSSGFSLDFHSIRMDECGGYFRMYLGYGEAKMDVNDNVYFKLKNNKVRAFIDGNAGNFLFVLPEGYTVPEEPKKPETPKTPETPVVTPVVPTDTSVPVEPVVTPVNPISEDTPEPVIATNPSVVPKKVSIKGRIVYKGGTPYGDYKVSLGNETVTSDKNGDFSFADRDYGSYLLKSDLFKLKFDFSKNNKVTDVFVDKNATVTKVINDKGVFINVIYNLETPDDDIPVNLGRKVILKKTPDRLPRTGGSDVSIYGFGLIVLALILIRKKK